MIRTEKPQRKEEGKAFNFRGASTISTRDFTTIIDSPLLEFALEANPFLQANLS